MILDDVIFEYIVMEYDAKEGKWEVQQSSSSLMDDKPCDESFFNVFVQQSPEVTILLIILHTQERLRDR